MAKLPLTGFVIPKTWNLSLVYSNSQKCTRPSSSKLEARNFSHALMVLKGGAHRKGKNHERRIPCVASRACCATRLPCDSSLHTQKSSRVFIAHNSVIAHNRASMAEFSAASANGSVFDSSCILPMKAAIASCQHPATSNQQACYQTNSMDLFSPILGVLLLVLGKSQLVENLGRVFSSGDDVLHHATCGATNRFIQKQSLRNAFVKAP